MKCLYHGDLDGKCSAYWVYHYFKKMDIPIELIEIDYNSDSQSSFPLEQINQGEIVWLVDFSPTIKEMVCLLERTQNVVWIDHHKTTIERFADFNHNISGIRDTSTAACVLTYLYIGWISSPKTRDLQFEYFPEMDLKVPFFTRLIGDMDTWKWHFGDTTKYFCAGLECYDTSPNSPIWEHMKELMDIIIMNGQSVTQATKMRNKRFANKISFSIEWEGYRWIAANYPGAGSLFFDDVDSDYDGRILFYWTGRIWSVSLYSSKIDVAQVAQKYGGGGHRGAAGFKISTLPFSLGNDDHIDLGRTIKSD